MQPGTLLLGVVAIFLALAVHELGHLIAGLAVGFRFSIFVIGPVLIERSPAGSIVVGWNRVPALFGGIAGTVPTRPEGLRWRFAIVIAGGPFASVLLALGAALVLQWFSVPQGLLRTELGWLRLLSSAIFLGTAIPLPNGPFVSDGLRLLRMVRRGPKGDRDLSLLTLTALEHGGGRPRDWDRSQIDRALEVRDGSMFECQSQFYSYMQALDSGLVETAGISIASALNLAQRLPGYLRGPHLVEAAYFEAARRANPKRARELLDQVPTNAFGVMEVDRLRAQAAIAVAEGEFGTARVLIAQAFACSPAWAAGPRAWLSELLRACPHPNLDR